MEDVEETKSSEGLEGPSDDIREPKYEEKSKPRWTYSLPVKWGLSSRMRLPGATKCPSAVLLSLHCRCDEGYHHPMLPTTKIQASNDPPADVASKIQAIITATILG